MSSGLFSEKIDIDGWIFYIIVPGTKIYRGSALEYISERDIPELGYFSDQKTAGIYGPVVQYEVKGTLKLLAMDELSNLEGLYEEADDDVRRAITSSFGYSPRRPHVIRDSDNEMDKMVANFICSMGLDGYAHEPIQSDTQRKFEPEIALCDAARKISRIQNMPYSVDKLEKAVREDRLIAYANEERRARKKPKRPTAPTSPITRGQILFGDDEEEDEKPPAPKRLAFGGY